MNAIAMMLLVVISGMLCGLTFETYAFHPGWIFLWGSVTGNIAMVMLYES